MSRLTPHADAILLIADREHLAKLTVYCMSLGGGWLEALSVFEQNPRVWAVVAFANDQQRIADATPLIHVAEDGPGLLAATIAAVRTVNGTAANKLFLIDKARAFVEPAILAATVAKGRA